MSTVVLIQNPQIQTLPDDALKYLTSKSLFELIIYDNSDTKNTILNEYSKGVRHFILSLTSEEIIMISDILNQLLDAKFVAVQSTLQTLRGTFKNVYFTSASNIYIAYIANLFQSLNACLVYDYETNPYIIEVIDIFKKAGIPTFKFDDSGWKSYALLVLASLDKNIWTIVNDNVDPDRQYNIVSLQAYPDPNLVFAPNIIAMNIAFPDATVQSQQNSYWNIISNPNAKFSMTANYSNIYPLLLNVDWDTLIKFNFMSLNNFTNGFYVSKYLLKSNIKLKYNLCNRYVNVCPKYIWLIDASYVTDWVINNLNYLKKTLPTIKRIKISTNISCDVCYYWNKGYRNFILDAPSNLVREVQKINLKQSFFVCPRSTDPTLRKIGGNCVFSLIDDNSFVNDLISTINSATLNRLYCVIGTSNNINIPLFVKQLDINGVKHVMIDELDSIPDDTVAIISVGNDSDFQKVFNYILNNTRFSQLTLIKKYGSYVNETQNAILLERGIQPDVSLINYNSSQPFLDSKYSELSRPPYLSNITFFLQLSNMLFAFNPKFLFDFGYYIDI